MAGLAACAPVEAPPTDTGASICRAEADATDPGRFGVGSQRRYRLTMTADARYDFQALFREHGEVAGNPASAGNPLAQNIRLSLSSVLEVTVLSREQDRYLVEYRFVQPGVRLWAGGQPNEETSAAVRQGLEGSFFAEVDERGRVAGVGVRAGIHNIAQGVARSLIGLTQFVSPEQGDFSRPWVAAEDDPNGIFHVRYEPVSVPGASTTTAKFRKTRIAYTAPDVAEVQGTVPVKKSIVPTGVLVADFDIRRRLLGALRGEDHQRISIGSREVAVSHIVLDLRLEQSGCLEERERGRRLSTLRESGSVPDSRAPLHADFISPEERERSIQRNVLGRDTLDSLMPRLARLSAAGRPAADASEVYLKFKALIYLYPDTSRAIARHLGTLKPADPAYQMLVGALSTVGHDPAQAVLLRLYEKSAGDPTTQAYLLRALAVVDVPSSATREHFMTLAARNDDGSVTTTAQLGLGIFARKLHARDRAASDALVRLFGERLRASTHAEDRQQWLLVLGNAGTPASFDVVAAYLEDPVPFLRATALNALRWQRGLRAETLLFRALREDREDEVRISAARTLDFRPMRPDVLKVIKLALAQDRSANVRKELFQILWRHRDLDPEAIVLIRQAATRDPDAGVREVARQLLQAANSPRQGQSRSPISLPPANGQ